MYLSPIYIIVVNSFKSRAEMYTNVLALPETFTWEYYAGAVQRMDFINVFKNSLIVTLVFGGGHRGPVLHGRVDAGAHAHPAEPLPLQLSDFDDAHSLSDGDDAPDAGDELPDQDAGHSHEKLPGRPDLHVRGLWRGHGRVFVPRICQVVGSCLAGGSCHH